ncbi:(R)-mandelonitrile lyase-like protein [Tanacetum coccineum]
MVSSEVVAARTWWCREVEKEAVPLGEPKNLNKVKSELKYAMRNYCKEYYFEIKDGIRNARGNVLGGGSMVNLGFYSRADNYFYNKSGIAWDIKNVEKSYEWVEDSVVSIPERLKLSKIGGGSCYG